MCPRFGKGLLTPVLIGASFAAASYKSLWTAWIPSPLGFEEPLGVLETGRTRVMGPGGHVTIRGGSQLDKRDSFIKGLPGGR